MVNCSPWTHSLTLAPYFAMRHAPEARATKCEPRVHNGVDMRGTGSCSAASHTHIQLPATITGTHTVYRTV